MKAMTALMRMRLVGVSSVALTQNVHITRRRSVSIKSFLEDVSAVKCITFELPDDVICVSITSLSGNASGMDFVVRSYGEEKLIEGIVVPWEKEKMNEF